MTERRETSLDEMLANAQRPKRSYVADFKALNWWQKGLVILIGLLTFGQIAKMIDPGPSDLDVAYEYCTGLEARTADYPVSCSVGTWLGKRIIITFLYDYTPAMSKADRDKLCSWPLPAKLNDWALEIKNQGGLSIYCGALQ